MDKRMKLIGLGAIGIIVLVLGVYLVTGGLEAKVFEAQTGTLLTLQQEEGRIVPATEFTISSPYGGKLMELAVEEGELVQQDGLLALLDTTELQFQLQQIDAHLKALRGEKGMTYQDQLPSQIRSQELLIEQARQDLKTAKEDLVRAEKLYDDGAITAKELSMTENLAASANLWLKQQEEALILLEKSRSPSSEFQQLYEGRAEALAAQRKLLEHQIEQGRIVAPITGVIADLTVKEGDPVAPGWPLMGLFGKGQYLIETYLTADSFLEIKEGMKVQLIQNKKGVELIFPGTVTRIAPTAVEKISPLGLTEQRIKITISPELPEDAHFVPGTLLDVEFIISQHKNVLFVPVSALFPYQEGDALWLVKEGKAKLQPVDIGFKNNRHVVITNGLEDGDLVITNPQLKGLKEGKKIF